MDLKNLNWLFLSHNPKGTLSLSDTLTKTDLIQFISSVATLVIAFSFSKSNIYSSHIRNSRVYAIYKCNCSMHDVRIGIIQLIGDNYTLEASHFFNIQVHDSILRQCRCLQFSYYLLFVLASALFMNFKNVKCSKTPSSAVWNT